MTDRELVLGLLSTLREHVDRARRRRSASFETFRGDLDLQDSLAMSLLVATQAAIDTAFHICADEAWGVPSSYAEAFSLLAQRTVIDAGLADDLRRVVAVRNRVAHLYGTLDMERMWNEMPAGLDALDRFGARVARFLGEAPQTEG